jgi:hypothetical protein
VGVEERWAEHTTPEELEALRASLLRLLTELRADTSPADLLYRRIRGSVMARAA